VTRTAHLLKAVFDPDERYRLRMFEAALPVPVQRCALRVLGERANPFHQAAAKPDAIFIHVPKTGGTSIATALGLEGAGHIPLSRYYAADPERLGRAFSFAIVRNPWDRLLSAYAYLSKRKQNFQFRDFRWAERYLSQFKDFEAFVLGLKDRRVREAVLDYIHFLPQVHWLTVPGHPEVRADYVGRFEELDRSFASIADRLEIEAKLPVTRTSNHGAYQDSYTDEMAAVVGDVYGTDAVTFGYDFQRAAEAAE
jgi:hypothetical protein